MDSHARQAAHARRVALARPSPMARATAALAALAIALPGSEGSQGLWCADGPRGHGGRLQGPVLPAVQARLPAQLPGQPP
eukprot:6527598-Alexandrium_andersonii.AAC.1